MLVDRSMVASKLLAYLHHELALSELVDWAEEMMQEAEFAPEAHDVVRDVVSRLGVADVRAFGLTWEDCERFLEQLGWTVRVEAFASS